MTQISSSQAYDSKTLLSRLWDRYLRPHRWWMLLALIFMMIEGSTLAFLSYMLQPMFDRVFVGGNETALIWIALMILALFLLRAVTNVSQKIILSRIAQTTSADMQKDLLAHLLTLDSAFFQKNPPGALIERVQGDTVAVQGVWSVIISGAGKDLVSLVGLFGVALSIDWLWTVLAIIGAPLLVLPIATIQRYIRRKAAGMREQASHRATRLDEVFHGINPIKLNLMEAYQSARFSQIVGRIVKVEIKIAATRAVIPSMIDIITGLGFFGVLIVGGQDIIAGDKTVGQFMSFFTAMSLAFQPLRRLGGIAGVWQVAAASLERTYRLFDTKPSILSPAIKTAAPERAQTEIRLQDVNFSYDDLPVLNNLTFIAPAGKTTALVGASGAGKSTVFNILTRLIEPNSGAVSVGGIAINCLDLADLRSLFSVVSQETMLFDDSLRENILLGHENINEADLTRALDAAHVSDFVKSMPDGLESQAGPRGSALSGGQRQRVSIARALLRNAPILLLDEATSALDAKSEAVVQTALEQLSHNRTTIVIAHRLSTIQNADKIIVMDQGRVVDEGSHKDLLAKDGIYGDLYRLQFKSETP